MAMIAMMVVAEQCIPMRGDAGRCGTLACIVGAAGTHTGCPDDHGMVGVGHGGPMGALQGSAERCLHRHPLRGNDRRGDSCGRPQRKAWMRDAGRCGAMRGDAEQCAALRGSAGTHKRCPYDHGMIGVGQCGAVRALLHNAGTHKRCPYYDHGMIGVGQCGPMQGNVGIAGTHTGCPDDHRMVDARQCGHPPAVPRRPSHDRCGAMS